MAGEVQNLDRARQLVAELIDLTGQAEKKCGSARTWGVFDILGGGTFSTAVKHLKIQSVQGIMAQINSRLRELKSCVNVLNLPDGYTLNRGFLATIADFAWDGFLSDIWMQSKIKASLNELRNLRSNLEQMQSELNALR